MTIFAQYVDGYSKNAEGDDTSTLLGIKANYENNSLSGSFKENNVLANKFI